MLATIVQSVTTIITFGSLFYLMAALWSARSFIRNRRAHIGYYPGVTILKPLKGFDPGMYEAFASHCSQQYDGDFEILFGVSSFEDPAVPIVDQLRDDFPICRIRLILCPEKLGLNGKISTVVQLASHARYEYLIVNDSDIHVSPLYLARIMSEFAPRQENGKPVGMVTTPYRGIAHRTIPSKLEALGISTDFIPGVLTALNMDGELRFGLGSTLAVSREALSTIGGFTPLLDALADDYELGYRISRSGFSVVLSREVVATSVPPYTLAGFFTHQLRWARTVRDARSVGYLGLIFTFGIPWAILNFVTSGFSLPSLALLSLTIAARITLALGVGLGILDDRQVLRDLWLLPIRDLLALWIWIWSFASHEITWRGEKFLLREGKLVKRSTDNPRVENPAA